MSLSGWLLLGGALWAIKSITNKDNEKSNAEHQNHLEELEKFEIEKNRLLLKTLIRLMPKLNAVIIQK